MNTTTEKKRFTTRDVMVIAAMMVLTFAVYGAVGALTLPFPFLYLYCAAGIQEFFCATFYLVVANRLNKHGILMVWSTVFGISIAACSRSKDRSPKPSVRTISSRCCSNSYKSPKFRTQP